MVLKIIKWTVLSVVAAAVLAACVLYFQASRVPAAYMPSRLTAQQKESAAGNFNRRLQDFSNSAQGLEPFTWSITQDEVNASLSSMDEIVNALPGNHRSVIGEMEKIGVVEPAVAFGDGVMTLMIRSSKYDKVFAADVSYASDGEGRLLPSLIAARVGDLPVPDSILRGQLARLEAAVPKKTARSKSAARGATGSVVGEEDLSAMMGAVLAALVRQVPIDAELTVPINKKKVRIERIEITPGLLTLHAAAVRLPAPQDQN